MKSATPRVLVDGASGCPGSNASDAPAPAQPEGGWAGRIGFAPPVLLLAWLLSPPRGDAILGLPSLCAFHRLTGLPCPGCGMTRALVCCAHGMWAAAVHYHPAGPLVFALLLALSLERLLSVCYPALRCSFSPWLIGRACWMGAAVLLLVWVARLDGLLPSPP